MTAAIEADAFISWRLADSLDQDQGVGVRACTRRALARGKVDRLVELLLTGGVQPPMTAQYLQAHVRLEAAHIDCRSTSSFQL